ncbi:IS3 family transposase [Blastococcus sp. PRF04-17]|uniref:IS3 family transposase n=1 Tax=Blastococcus sp. PRF04-17 TaxID=2933797 RepID=UPI0035304862
MRSGWFIHSSNHGAGVPPKRSARPCRGSSLRRGASRRSDNYGVYGARKLHAELHRKGHRVARCTVERLMRSAGLRGISRAKGPRTTLPGAGPDTRPDLVDRAFTATGPVSRPEFSGGSELTRRR